MIDRITHLSREEYRAFDAVSQSDVKRCWENPQLYYEQHIAKTRPKDPTSASQQWGIDCEECLREGLLVNNWVIVPSDVLNKQGHRKGKAWEEFSAASSGLRIVTMDEHYEFADACANVACHEHANALVYSPDARWSERFTWQCGLTGMQLKCEMDLLSDGWVCDIKTAADVDPASFERDVIRLGYDIQAAMYMRAANLLLEQEWRYYWVVVRNRPPFNCEVYEASDALLEYGNRRLDARLDFYHECRKSNRWVSPTHGVVQVLYPPRYARELV